MINNKEKIQAQIEELEVKIKELKEQVNKEEETLIDFSEFIGRN
jgi:peptidoglycan hydrolase CwlO-like protein